MRVEIIVQHANKLYGSVEVRARKVARGSVGLRVQNLEREENKAQDVILDLDDAEATARNILLAVSQLKAWKDRKDQL